MENLKPIIDFAIKKDYKDIPLLASRIAKKAILDGIGVAIAGNLENASEIIINLVNEFETKGSSTILKGGNRVLSIFAAMANGMLIHSLDFDDENIESVLHTTSVLLPSILAVGEQENASGKVILAAYVLSFELMTRISKIILPFHYDRGWHPTATIGTLGAAAGAAKILGLEYDKFKNSLGIAASLVGGLFGNTGSMVKPLHAGIAASNGLLAALLAKKNFTASKDIFEDKWGGFFNVYGNKIDYLKLNCAIDFGEDYDYEIIKSGILFKKYPTCLATHSSIDATLYLVNENDIISSEIDKIICFLHPERINMVSRPIVKNSMEAKFSVQYCIAKAILNKCISVEDFQENIFPLSDEILKLMHKVEIMPYIEEIRNEGEKISSKVVIKFLNHKELTYEIKRPFFSDISLPLNQDFLLLDKYRKCCKRIISETAINDSIELIKNLEKLKNIKELTEIYRTSFLKN